MIDHDSSSTTTTISDSTLPLSSTVAAKSASLTPSKESPTSSPPNKTDVIHPSIGPTWRKSRLTKVLLLVLFCVFASIYDIDVGKEFSQQQNNFFQTTEQGSKTTNQSTTKTATLQQPHPDTNQSPSVSSFRASYLSEDGEFDYHLFWLDSWQMALENNQTLTDSGRWQVEQQTKPPSAPPKGACPKVYLYNLSEAYRDVKLSDTDSVDYAFGEAEADFRGTLRRTDQYGMGMLFENRLRQPGNCYVTQNPQEADLFFAPLFTKGKKGSQWKKACSNVNMTHLIHELKHLNGQTSCRHFFIYGKGHLSSWSCRGWYTDPIPQLKNAIRLAYSYETNQTWQHLRPNLFSIPYPSSLHWSDEAVAQDSKFVIPWQKQQKKQRRVLMSYVGRFDHGDVDVRQRIQKQCEYYEDRFVCSIPQHGETARKATVPSDQILVKGRSVFCLEPEGDTPFRKSLSDSISFGCIPVLFSNVSDDVSHWHWGHWKNQGRVLIDRQSFIDGKIDLQTLLLSIPLPLKALMQRTVAKFARQFQVSLSQDYMNGGDLVHTALVRMKQHAEEATQKGMCS